MKTVLVVDDEPEIRDIIHVYLRNEGYSVIEASNGLEALKALKTNNVQLVILDVMMPQMDGLQACLKIRELSDVSIIMLSAKQEDIDKIAGLTTGADDYMVKPFNPLELIARVKAQFRRSTMQDKQAMPSVIQIKGLVIDKAKHSVKVKGTDIPLTPLEFSILELLASHPGQVFSSEKIYEKVWDEPFGFTENTVMVHIRNLREKIEEKPRSPEYVKTVWGVGYKIDL